MAYFRGNSQGYYYVTSNSTTSSTGSMYWTSNNYGYSGNWTGKGVQDYKNKEMKHLLSKERGW